MRLIDNGNADTDNMNWDNIKTITEFDGDISFEDDVNVTNRQGVGNGDGTTSSSSRYSDQKNIGELAAGKPTTSTSLLIESLIQLLCLILEDDAQLANQSYLAICEQLEKINLIDESYAMQECEEMRSQYQMQIYKIIRAVGGHEIPKSLPTITTRKTQPIETCWSRYHREFDEVEFIAGGGFGKVFKARHKLDCIEYAIKQIKIHSTTIKLCHLAEVKTIASLNHPNIVQYKAAWLEPFVPEKNSLSMLQTESYNFSETDTNSNHTKFSNSTRSSFSEISIHRPAAANEESSDFIEFERSQEQTGASNTTNSCNQVICKYESNSMEESSCVKPKLAILYIQMSLCQLTLRKWLDDRNACNSLDDYYLQFFNDRADVSHYDIVHDIFCQILAGVNYIHSKNIIHHDIKPSNIFLELDSDGRLTAQLGDFGLACPLQNGHRGIALGTPLYAAPEQLNGECNPKSDIYSLGIVLIELLMKFGTDMERVRTIENARKGTLPPMLNNKSTKLLQSLLSHERIRPTTKDLMEVIRKINLEQNLRALRVATEVERQTKDTQITDLLNQINTLGDTTDKMAHEMKALQSKVHEQDHEIAELKCSVYEKDAEIASLRIQLEKYQKLQCQ